MSQFINLLQLKQGTQFEEMSTHLMTLPGCYINLLFIFCTLIVGSQSIYTHMCQLLVFVGISSMYTLLELLLHHNIEIL